MAVGTTNQRNKFRVASLLGAVLGVASVLFVAIAVAHAQQGDNLREAAQNPIADLISVPFQNNTNFDIGRSENTQNVLNIQPVYPVRLNRELELDHPANPSGDLPAALLLRKRACRLRAEVWLWYW